MSIESQPRVSIVTPMYNNAEFLTECIESILSQTYQNWDYVIVNNCSTDGSAEIAHGYAKQHPRIRVQENSAFLPAVANHNLAMRQISSASKYCKMVFSDDWIFPRCLEEMVALAETHPSVGIVSAYGLQGQETAVKWDGLPYPSSFLSGRDICRRYFLDGVYVFGTSQSVLFRSDLVRARPVFFNEANPHSDREICIDLLRNCDFGFVHQILTYTRERAGSLTEVARRMNSSVGGRLYEVVTFGSHFLTPRELQFCRRRLISEYYNYLAVSIVQGRRDPHFWDMHKSRLAQSGIKFSLARLVFSLIKRVIRAVLHPHETVQKLR